MIRIAGYPMDLALSEEHSFPGEVTAYPVEEGPDISDHIRVLPEVITLESLVSDTPIGEVATDPTRTGGALASEDALHKLLEIRNERRPVTIETSLGVFESMALESLDVPKDAEKTGGLFFTATFRRLLIVTNRRKRVATQMAGAAGGSAKRKVVDPFVTINKRILWRMGTPSGAPLKPNYLWAFVEQAKNTTPDAVSTDPSPDQKVPHEDYLLLKRDARIIYRYTGEAHPLVAQYVLDVTRGRRLADDELESFRLDRDRDIEEERAKRLQALRNDPALNRNARILPWGHDKARFPTRPPLRTSATEARKPLAAGGF